MKLTIEPTGAWEARSGYPKATIELDGNEWSLTEICTHMESLLIAWGYSAEGVKDCFVHDEDVKDADSH